MERERGELHGRHVSEAERYHLGPSGHEDGCCERQREVWRALLAVQGGPGAVIQVVELVGFENGLVGDVRSFLIVGYPRSTGPSLHFDTMSIRFRFGWPPWVLL